MNMIYFLATALLYSQMVDCTATTNVFPANDQRCHDHKLRSERKTLNIQCSRYAPVSFATLGPGINPNIGFRAEYLYNIERVAGDGNVGTGAWLLTEGTYISMIIETDQNKAILVDAPEGNWGPSSQFLLSAIQSVTSQPIGTLIYSHAHLDHIGNAKTVVDHFSQFGPVDIVCHKFTDNLLQSSLANGDLRRPACTTTFTGGDIHVPHQVIVGNQTVSLSYRSGGHQEGNIFIWHDASKTLMLVDVIFPLWSPFLNLALSSNVMAYYENHNEVLSFPFHNFIGGHIAIKGTRDQVEVVRNFMGDLQVASLDALIGPNAPDFLELIGELGIFNIDSNAFLNQYVLFQVYFDRAIDICEQLLLDEWVPLLPEEPLDEGRTPRQFDVSKIKLAGIDVFLRSQCFTAIESIRIDGNPVSLNKKRNDRINNRLDKLNKDETEFHKQMNIFVWKELNRGN